MVAASRGEFRGCSGTVLGTLEGISCRRSGEGAEAVEGVSAKGKDSGELLLEADLAFIGLDFILWVTGIEVGLEVGRIGANNLMRSVLD